MPVENPASPAANGSSDGADAILAESPASPTGVLGKIRALGKDARTGKRSVRSERSAESSASPMPRAAAAKASQSANPGQRARVDDSEATIVAGAGDESGDDSDDYMQQCSSPGVDDASGSAITAVLAMSLSVVVPKDKRSGDTFAVNSGERVSMPECIDASPCLRNGTTCAHRGLQLPATDTGSTPGNSVRA